MSVIFLLKLDTSRRDRTRVFIYHMYEKKEKTATRTSIERREECRREKIKRSAKTTTKNAAYVDGECC